MWEVFVKYLHFLCLSMFLIPNSLYADYDHPVIPDYFDIEERQPIFVPNNNPCIDAANNALQLCMSLLNIPMYICDLMPRGLVQDSCYDGIFEASEMCNKNHARAVDECNGVATPADTPTPIPPEPPFTPCPDDSEECPPADDLIPDPNA